MTKDRSFLHLSVFSLEIGTLRRLFFFGEVCSWNFAMRVAAFLLSASERPQELKISLPDVPTQIRRYSGLLISRLGRDRKNSLLIQGFAYPRYG